VSVVESRAISLARTADGQACIVSLVGEHDLSTIADLQASLTEAATAPVTVVDLSATAFIDSAVLGALIASHRDAVDAHRGWSLVVGNGSGAAVRRILELTGLDAVLPVHARQEDAIAAAGSGGQVG
jgi:anti-anti-sigma factor